MANKIETSSKNIKPWINLNHMQHLHVHAKYISQWCFISLQFEDQKFKSFYWKIPYQNVCFSEKHNLFLSWRNWKGPCNFKKYTVQAKAQEVFSSGSGWMDQFSIEMLIQIIQLFLPLFLWYRTKTFLQSV